MRKILKVLGIFFGALLVLIVAAAVALPLFVDPNDFKPRIEAAVEEATGRDLEIAGDIGLSVFPWLGADLGAVRLGNAPGFADEPFASVEGVQVRVKLLPLLAREIKIGKVLVEQPVIRLQRDAEGRANWDDLAGEAADEEAPGAGDDDAVPPDFSIDGLEIRGAHIMYSDAAADMNAELKDFNLEAGNVGLPADFPLSMSGSVAVSNPEISGEFEFGSHISADPDTQRYRLADGELSFKAAGAALPVSPLDGQLAWQEVLADMEAGVANVRAFVARIAGARVAIDAEASSLADAPRAEGELTFDIEDLADLAGYLGDRLPEGLDLSGPANGRAAFQYDEGGGTGSLGSFEAQAAGMTLKMQADAEGLPDAVRANGNLDLSSEDLAVTARQLGTLAPEGMALDGPMRLALTFGYDQPADTAKLSEFSAEVLGVSLAGNATASGLSDQAQVSGEIRSGEFSPGRLLVKLGQELPATRDGEVLDSAALQATFEATPNSALVENLSLTLDQSKLTGRVEIADLEKQAMRFDLALDEIDADRYLPPADEQAAQDAGAEVPLDEIEIPAEMVRGLDIAGNIAIGKLKAFDFNSTDVQIGVTARNDRLRIHPARASFYGGGYNGDMQLDASGKMPRVSVDEHVERVQLAPLVKDVMDVENISGTARMNIAATGRGKTLGALRKTLRGDFAVDVQDGAIEGFNLWESIREAYATIKGRSYDRGNAPERTEFAELSASGRIDKGVVHNDDLSAKLPFLRVNGAGQIDIAEATMDYTIETRVLKSPELTGGIEELTGTTIPVRLTGPLTDPKVRPDVKGVLEQKAKEALERKEQEVRDKADERLEEEKERAKDKLKDKLKDFFG